MTFRRKFYFVLAGLIGICSIAYLIPVLAGKAQAEPLQGYFGSAKCACGHEIFVELSGDKAYDTCPGHRDRRYIGKVVRSGNEATIISSKRKEPYMKFIYDGGEHRCDFLISGGSAEPIEQVTNPWRTVLPKYLPEDW